MKRSTCGCAVAVDSTGSVLYEYQVLLPESDPFVLAELLDGPGGERLRAEAQRNMTDNPDGFTGLRLSALQAPPTRAQRRTLRRSDPCTATVARVRESGAHDRFHWVPQGSTGFREVLFHGVPQGSGFWVLGSAQVRRGTP